jgi:hypothetical protein
LSLSFSLFGPYLRDQLEAQPFFQCLDFQAGPLQFLRQQYDLFGFGTGRRRG